MLERFQKKASFFKVFAERASDLELSYKRSLSEISYFTKILLFCFKLFFYCFYTFLNFKLAILELQFTDQLYLFTDHFKQCSVKFANQNFPGKPQTLCLHFKLTTLLCYLNIVTRNNIVWKYGP